MKPGGLYLSARLSMKPYGPNLRVMALMEFSFTVKRLRILSDGMSGQEMLIETFRLS